jgi:hypothetical protein
LFKKHKRQVYSLSIFLSLPLSSSFFKNIEGKSVYSYSASIFFENIEGKSIYSYSLSPSLSPPPFKGSILRKYIEEAYRRKKVYREGK